MFMVLEKKGKQDINFFVNWNRVIKKYWKNIQPMCIFNYLEHTIAFDERKIFEKPNIGLNIYTLEMFRKYRDSKRLERAVKEKK